MSFEPLYIESWIYSTLHGDSTLTGLLATVADEATGYQQGVYLHMAPQVDNVSGEAPQVPYIVVTREDTGGDDMSISGERALVDMEYRVTIWDGQNGAVAMDRLIDVADRVDALLHNQVQTTTNPIHYCRRIRTGTAIEEVQGGGVFYGAYAIYQFQARG